MADTSSQAASTGKSKLPMISYVRAETQPRPRRKSGSFLVALFLISFALPVLFFIGPLRLSPYRVILILAFVPCVVSWISGASGKIRTPDFLILLSAIWSGITLFLAHGAAAIEPAGILIIETFGTYLLARWCIRNTASFLVAARSLVLVVLCLLPFAIFETVTGRHILLDLARIAFQTFDDVNMEPRLGLFRAQGPFEHPILFGVICASAFALGYYALGNKTASFGTLLRSGIIAIVVACSLSVGAFLSLVVQLILMAWDKCTRSIPSRWGVLASLCAVFYLIIDALSNRTPVEVFISYLTFNVGNSYNRVLIWHFGSQEVLRNPLFGIGFNEWARAYWMSDSMDNFWLVVAVRHGLPALLLLVLAVVIIMYKIGRLKGLDERILACRTGLLISLTSMMIAACTVHLWNASYSLFMFLVGAGVWMLDEKPAVQTSRSDDNGHAEPLSPPTPAKARSSRDNTEIRPNTEYGRRSYRDTYVPPNDKRKR